MTMNTGLHRIEVTGLGGLAKLTGFAKLIGIGGGSAGRPEQKAARTSRSGFVWLTAALMIGFGAWTYLSEDASNNSEPLQLAAAAAPEPASTAAKPDPELTTAATPVEAPPPAEAAAAAEIPPIDGLKISSQSWRRGGLGSKALVTFTLRNGNDYAVKDIEITCAFNRMDGSHLTDRKRVIHDTVNMKSRKTFARMHSPRNQFCRTQLRVWSARPRGRSEPEMPVARYFLLVGGVLLALLFLLNEVLPQLPVAERVAESGSNKSVIRINSDRKWPERVVFDTNMPTIVPPIAPVLVAKAEAAVPAPAAEAAVSAQARGLQAFAQLKPSEPRKPEPKPQHKRRIAKTRFAPPMVVVAQQPRFGFFANDTW